MRKSHAMKWINALRSGEYKQGPSLLHNTDANTYCCLGVLDKIFPELDLSGSSHGLLNNYDLIGLRTGWGTITAGIDFAQLNDTLEFNFNEIADIVQIEYVEGL